jgi:hypothetical protein
MIIDFLIKFISDNNAILVSLLALGISAISFSTSSNSYKLSKKISEEAKKLKAFEQRAEILEIHDKRNAKIGNLQSIYAEQHLLLINNPKLIWKYPNEIERIINNTKANQIASSPDTRKYFEALDDNVDIATNTKTLADAKRFLILIEEEVVKEERRLNILKDELKEINHNS